MFWFNGSNSTLAAVSRHYKYSIANRDGNIETAGECQFVCKIVVETVSGHFVDQYRDQKIVSAE